ncbi:MAG: ABC transporter ATP-binding protein [Puniceicoccaceae bacterium]|nr:MAG: ABC transporter ATP-binding protein [Puniceicoccaceae bacterium]
MAFLQLRHVSKGFGPAGPRREEVLHDINLAIAEGEFVAVVGFSGAGKSTLINLLSGLQTPDTGEVLLGGRLASPPGPDRGVVFQNYSLLPWLTVRGNIALAVDRVFAHWPRHRRRAHVDACIDLVRLTAAAHRRPAELSGGMRQRVALARTLAIKPKILLMDEPLGALDALTRGKLQSEIESLWSRERVTAVMITNDVDEGILLADRIIPLTPGPRATLGPEWRIGLARPRDRRALNHDPEFKRIRAEIGRYLENCRRDRAGQAAAALHPLPDLRPRNLDRDGAFTWDWPGRLRSACSAFLRRTASP